jgi:uncharacterized membrane protein YdjX (TVP38/TMEM64 family)
MDAESEKRDHPEPPPRIAVFSGLALLAGLVVLVLTIHPLREAAGDALSGDTEALRADLNGLGAAGVLLVLALAMVHAIVWYPAEILNAAAGFVYGFWGAMALMMTGWLLNGILCHQIGRHAARPVLNRLLREERLERWEAAVERGGITLLIAVRLVPIIPFSLISYVAGSARVPLPRFIWTTLVGYIPLTGLFVYLGTRLESLSATDPAIWGGALVLIALLLVTRKVMPMLGVEAD